MSEPFLSEIKVVAFDFAPRGWAQCDGQLLPINQNQALFELIGTRYGGDAITNFALPNLKGRVPIHRSSAHLLADKGGSSSVTLTQQQIPAHTHALRARAETPELVAGNTLPTGKSIAQGLAALQGASVAPVNLYGPPNDLVPMAADMVGTVGGGQAHENMMPSLTLNFCIALSGIHPTEA